MESVLCTDAREEKMKGNVLLALFGLCLVYWVWSGQPSFSDRETPTVSVQQPIVASIDRHEFVAIPYVDQQFTVQVRINGIPMPFVVDTGAMDTVLTSQAAELLGDAVIWDGSIQVSNAFGEIRVAGVAHVKEMRIGHIVVVDVPVLIVTTGSRNLLGLSLLTRLSRFEYQDRQLVLEQ